jgi:hypothetical protein
LTTIGTNDVLYWQTFLTNLHAYGGVGLYHQVHYFNHPPFMIHVLYVLDSLTSLTGLAFPFWLRLPAILADLGSVVLVWQVLDGRMRARERVVLVTLLAIAPPSILISGFHGNTDPVMILFVLLSMYLLDRKNYPALAGVAFGMSLNIKVAALIFVPILVLYLPTLETRMRYVAATGVTFVLGSVPYLMQDPGVILEQVFGYNSLYGDWGLSRLTTLRWSRDYLGLLDLIYRQWGKYLALATIGGLACWMNWGQRRPSLFIQGGSAAFLFLAVTPGFGVQYLAWLVPWVVGVGLRATLIYYTASGLFLFVVYDFWAQEFPWRLADSGAVGNWRGWIIGLELICWAAVLVVLGILLSVVRRHRARTWSPSRWG